MKKEQEKETNIVTRFAPSPTGFMHVGGVRTALFAWLCARKHNGIFILRIEDTDKEREVEGSISHIQESLTWLGLDWDFGPGKPGKEHSYIQSERLDVYKKYAHILIEKGYAYADPYSESDLENFRKKSEEEKRPFLYREYRPENPPAWDGTKPLRFKVQNLKRYEWHDAVWGDLSAGEEALDDFILIKSDGYPTYNFAHIVDDIEMGVTHVMRGQEFISSTPKFLSLYEALGVDAPVFVTLPPIMAPDGKKKLSKRDGAKDLLEYKQEGYIPDAFINFLALLGWNPGTDQEIFTREELINAFDITKIQHSGAGLNEEKLNWINKEHIKKISSHEQFEILKTYTPEEIKKLPQYTEDRLKKITHLVIERIEKWIDVTNLFAEGDFVYFFTQPEYAKEILYWKDEKDSEKTKARLSEVLKLIETGTHENFTDTETVKALIWDYANTEGRGQVLWPLRVALSGREKSADPFTLMSILGKEESVSRIKKAIEIL